jgi:hypothetical protein
VLGVQRRQRVDLVALHLARLPIFRFEVEDRIALMPQVRSLIGRRHEPARPVGRSADRPAAGIEHHDITR